MDYVESTLNFVQVPFEYDPYIRAPLMTVNYTSEQSNWIRQLYFAYEGNICTSQVFELTGKILGFLPNNYKAFTMRRRILFAYRQPALIEAELGFSGEVLARDGKNYYQWYHRIQLLEFAVSIGLTYPLLDEFAYIDALLQADQKNFHLWEHRIWMCKLLLYSVDFDTANVFLTYELAYSEEKLRSDVLNNSFWSYRAFIAHQIQVDTFSEFLLYKELIEKAPNSEPGWNFLAGLFDYATDDLKVEIYRFALEYCTGDAVLRGPALFMCCDLSWFMPEVRSELKENCLLASQFDLPHRNYWAWVAEHLNEFGPEQ